MNMMEIQKNNPELIRLLEKQGLTEQQIEFIFNSENHSYIDIAIKLKESKISVRRVEFFIDLENVNKESLSN